MPRKVWEEGKGQTSSFWALPQLFFKVIVMAKGCSSSAETHKFGKLKVKGMSPRWKVLL